MVIAKQVKKEEVHYERAGASLLSLQPEDFSMKTKSDPTWIFLCGHLEARLKQLRNWRQSWWTQNWYNLATYLLPRRSTFYTQSSGGIPTPNNMTRGRELNKAIQDPTGTFAVRVCSSGMMSGLASASRPWFKIVPATKGINIPSDGRAWLDEVEERVYTILAKSNFYNSFAQECEDLVVYGTAPCLVYEDEEDIIRCYNPANGEYFLGTGATLRVDTFYRTFVYTIQQIVDFFGVENCPEDIVQLWNQKGSSLDVERIIAHSIEPNYDLPNCPRIPGNFAWREVYWVYGSSSKAPLSKRGFVEQPYTAARWATQCNDAYGRSPGMDVLPDVIQLQFETVRKAEGIEKGLRPPLQADMQMKNQPSSILPGHITYVPNLSASSGMRSIYDVKFDLQWVVQDIALIQNRIQRGLFNDLFLMLESAPQLKMTAYEVAQKIQEKLQVLGPVIENIITESLKPKLKRIYGIIQRKNILPPMPDSMKGIPLDLEFISMLAVAQKASATGGLERIAAVIGNLVGVFPEAKNKLNVYSYIDEMNALLANPEKIINGEEKIKEIEQAQRQQMEQQQAMINAQQMAETTKIGADAANVLSETQVGAGKSALQQMIEGV